MVHILLIGMLGVHIHICIHGDPGAGTGNVNPMPSLTLFVSPQYDELWPRYKKINDTVFMEPETMALLHLP